MMPRRMGAAGATFGPMFATLTGGFGSGRVGVAAAGAAPAPGAPGTMACPVPPAGLAAVLEPADGVARAGSTTPPPAAAGADVGTDSPSAPAAASLGAGSADLELTEPHADVRTRAAMTGAANRRLINISRD